MVVYVLKVLVWSAGVVDTDWYWGSASSGHTPVVAAFAVATVIGVTRIWRRGALAVFIAAVWILAVAISRRCLGSLAD
jgi:hypothetical protein